MGGAVALDGTGAPMLACFHGASEDAHLAEWTSTTAEWSVTFV